MENSFESLECILCLKDNAEKLFEKNSFKIVKCRGCGLIYVNPRYDEKTLSQLYESSELDSFDYLLMNKEVDAKTFEKRLDLIESYKRAGNLLDVGCAIGVLLGVARKRKWNCFGVELTQHASNYCKTHGLNVFTGLLEDAGFEDNFFDVVTLTGVIEHLRDPLKALKLVRKKIKDDGLLLLTTPDIGSLHARLFGRHWLQLKPEEHIYYFSSKTMTKLLVKAGFEVILYKHVGNFRNLKTVIEKLGGYNKLLYNFLSLIFPDNVSEKICFYVNPFDELLVLARPKK